MTITDPATDPDISGPLDQFLASHEQELIAFRRQLHANPELSWEEHQTTAAVTTRLEVAGLTTRPLNTETGLVVDLDGAGPGPTVALRADMDALPLDDEKDVPYRSTKEGVCHACGHDVHTTIALGAALALAGILPEAGIPGRVRIIFQPAEESIPGGAVRVSQSDVLDDVEVIYALHCDPSLDVGKVGLRVGPITSAADRVHIHLHGPGGHTARPHLTTDIVHVAARIITDLPAGLVKLTDVRDGATLVFGSVQSGHAPNVIPSSAEILGTLRVRGRATWDEAPEVVERVLASIVAPFGAEYELDYRRGSPPVDNDARATAVLREATRRALGTDAAVPTEHSLGNEDFSWFLEHVPGSYARLGVRPVGSERSLDIHASNFDADEHAIAAGVRVMTHAALAALQEYGAREPG